MRIPIENRYFSPLPADTLYPPEVHEYNERFTSLLQNIKKRHDPTVTAVAQGVLEWKRKQNANRIHQSVQEWLDRFYMSRIGIRFLIGQRALGFLRGSGPCLTPDIALNTLQPHPDYVGIICTRAVSVDPAVQSRLNPAWTPPRSR